jgi:hypothetical protein
MSMPQDLVPPDRPSADDGREAKLELERDNAFVLGVILRREQDTPPLFLRRFASRP